MGAAGGVLVTDPALAGSCAVSTARVLAAALGGLEFDLVLAGVDTSDGGAGVVPAGGRGAGRPAVPLVRGPDRARRGGRPGPRPAAQPDRLRRHRGAAAGPRLVHPGARRAALPVAQGDHGRPVEGDRRPLAGGPRGRPARRSAARWRRPGSCGPRRHPPAGATRVVREPAPVAAAAGRRLPRRAEAHLMSRHPRRRRGRRGRRPGPDQHRGRDARADARRGRRAPGRAGSSSRPTRTRQRPSSRATCPRSWRSPRRSSPTGSPRSGSRSSAERLAADADYVLARRHARRPRRRRDPVRAASAGASSRTRPA